MSRYGYQDMEDNFSDVSDWQVTAKCTECLRMFEAYREDVIELNGVYWGDCRCSEQLQVGSIKYTYDIGNDDNPIVYCQRYGYIDDGSDSPCWYLAATLRDDMAKRAIEEHGLSFDNPIVIEF